MSLFVVSLDVLSEMSATDVVAAYMRHEDEFPDLGPSRYMVAAYFGSVVVTVLDGGGWRTASHFVTWLGELEPSTGSRRADVRQLRELRGGTIELFDRATLESAESRCGTWGLRR